MHVVTRKLAGMTGAVLTLTSGALIALGTTPASADSIGYWVQSSIRSQTAPSYDALAADTRSEADARCVDHFKLRARGVSPEAWGGGPGNWQMSWRCTSN